MQNFINWFEIPASNFDRAVEFYKAVLKTPIGVMFMDGMRMGMLPTNGKNASGAIMEGEGYIPGEGGTRIYLNAGKDLNVFLDRVEPAGGVVVVPKTEISPGFGFFALFKDCEGNLVAFHSTN